MNAKERARITREIPWVHEVKKTEQCEGFRYSKMPLKAFYGTKEERDAASARYRCKNQGTWRYEALKPRHGYDHVSQSGKYCTNHLHSLGFNGGQRERDRLDRWMNRHYPELMAE